MFRNFPHGCSAAAAFLGLLPGQYREKDFEGLTSKRTGVIRFCGTGSNSNILRAKLKGVIQVTAGEVRAATCRRAFRSVTCELPRTRTRSWGVRSGARELGESSRRTVPH